MAIIKADKDNFEQEIANGKVLVDFYADWCGPCQALSPILEMIDSEINDLKIIKVDVDANPDIASQYGVMSMPTLILMQNGQKIDQKLGLMPKEELSNWIQSK